MSEIVKICKKHGELNINQVYEEKINNGLSFSFRCCECRRDQQEKNKDKILQRSREYEKNRRKRPESHKEKMKEYARNWRRKNADLVNARIKLDREKNPEKYREYDRKWRRENLIKKRELDVIRKHNISYEEYKWMFAKQNGLCEICGEKETRRSRTEGQLCRLTIDHNHATGKIRDLLCHACNQVIGHSRESIEILEKAIEYIKKHN